MTMNTQKLGGDGVLNVVVDCGALKQDRFLYCMAASTLQKLFHM